MGKSFYLCDDYSIFSLMNVDSVLAVLVFQVCFFYTFSINYTLIFFSEYQTIQLIFRWVVDCHLVSHTTLFCSD